METPVAAAPPAAPPTASLSLFRRAVMVYTKPAAAWSGLEERAQWWFPMLVLMLVTALVLVATYHRAVLPMIIDQFDEKVSSGDMSPAARDQAIGFISSPLYLGFTTAIGIGFSAAMQFVTALAVWFGCSFVLGKRMTYRWALEVATWSALVLIPTQLITGGLSWVKENIQSAHAGFGILLPEQDPPTKLMTALGVLLDGIGPLAIWYVAVLVIGAAAMSGAARRSVAWVVGGLYLVLLGFGAALATLRVQS